MSESFEQARASFFVGLSEFKEGHYAAAEAAFEASLALVPGRASTLANLGAARLRLGKPESALEALELALAADPADLEAWSHKGVALAALGRHEDALACHERVLAVEPRRAANELQRAVALNALGRPAEALRACAAATALQAGHAEAWFRHGQTLQYLDRHAEALDSYERALGLDPTLAQAWSNQGGILRDMNRLEEAAIAYRQAIANGGDPELHAYFLASVTGRAAPVAAPVHYVGALFDDYAATFDSHLVEVLHYRGHEILVEHLRALEVRRYASALDLGCGTGLCGALVRPLVDRLEGVDLSTRMLAKAAARGIYDGLVHADIAEHLKATPQRHDLVLAADVLIYIGDLAPVFAGAARVTEPGGVFCFSAELGAGEGADFELRPSLRYSHAETYLQRLAEASGFEVLRSVEGAIREDQRQAIRGVYLYLRRR